MSKIINVIWVEDMPEKMDSFKDLANSEHINLTNFKINSEAMKALEETPELWDAIILDATGFHKTTEETISLRGLTSSLTYISNLKQANIDDIPVFVFTGQPHLIDNESFEQMISGFENVNIYYKSKDDNKLIDDILDQCSKTRKRTIRIKYADELELFEIKDHFSNINIEESRKQLFNILYKLEFNIEAPIKNEIRTLLETILPEIIKYLGGEVNKETLNTYKRILTNYEFSNVQNSPGNLSIISQAMQNTIRLLIESTQEGSHNLQLIVGKYGTQQLKYSLLELLSWYKAMYRYVKDNGPFRDYTQNTMRNIALQTIEELGIRSTQRRPKTRTSPEIFSGTVQTLLASMIVVKLENDTIITINESSKGLNIGDSIKVEQTIYKGKTSCKLV